MPFGFAQCFLMIKLSFCTTRKNTTKVKCLSQGITSAVHDADMLWWCWHLVTVVSAGCLHCQCTTLFFWLQLSNSCMLNKQIRKAIYSSMVTFSIIINTYAEIFWNYTNILFFLKFCPLILASIGVYCLYQLLLWHPNSKFSTLHFPFTCIDLILQ